MRLLIRPLPLAHESRQGYVLRLSSLNGFDHPRWFVPFAIASDERGGQRALLEVLTGHDNATLSTLRGPISGLGLLNTRDSGDVAVRYWNTRFQRYCPICLAATRYHRAIWGLTFGVACHEHAVWLRDDCPECGQSIRWTGAPLGKCSCGAPLETAAALPCTENARSYVRMLASALHPCSTIAQAFSPKVGPLNIDQLLRITWFLGAYAIRQKAKAQKISGVMRLDHAISMVEATATVLFDWPSGFHMLLDELGKRSRLAESGNRLPAHFGRFYPTLYKGFPEPSFAVLREEFERYIANHWSGQLNKRNRRISQASRDSNEWISIKEAAKILHMRTTKVKQLVVEGVLIGRFFSTTSGRKMGSVLKASVDDAAGGQANLVTLAEAREMSGLSKKRLYKLVGEGHLRAARGPRVDGYPIWQFDRAALERAISLDKDEDGGNNGKIKSHP
ncbi:Regulatory protein MerR (modular protein) [Cupriavidus taiwanensis]|nr:Regulatory protein MerR (modular protein) [Cupriavidus taiwanensis]